MMVSSTAAFVVMHFRMCKAAISIWSTTNTISSWPLDRHWNVIQSNTINRYHSITISFFIPQKTVWATMTLGAWHLRRPPTWPKFLLYPVVLCCSFVCTLHSCWRLGLEPPRLAFYLPAISSRHGSAVNCVAKINGSHGIDSSWFSRGFWPSRHLFWSSFISVVGRRKIIRMQSSERWR